MKDLNIPLPEKKRFHQMVRSAPELLDTNHIYEVLKTRTKTLINDPRSNAITELLIDALKHKQPFSAIRLGDGEMNLLAFSKYPNMPDASLKTAQETVNKRQHSFKTSKTWLFVLEEMMNTAMLESDLIGILGLWRPNAISLDGFLKSIDLNFRGRWGQWVGLDHIKSLALKGAFDNKNIAPAHLYFSIIEHLDELLQHSEHTFLITDQTRCYQLLSQTHPDCQFKLISTPISKRPLANHEPVFLYNIMSQLPQSMQGTLSLIGAGPWSEFYCYWIRRRGGVAVDIGTGFDLLLGKQVRPVHRKVKLNLNRYE